MTRKETIIAAILLIVFGTSMHFVHHVPFFNHFMGYFFPVAESVMAHMKMVFYPMLLLSLYLTISRRTGCDAAYCPGILFLLGVCAA